MDLTSGGVKYSNVIASPGVKRFHSIQCIFSACLLVVRYISLKPPDLVTNNTIIEAFTRYQNMKGDQEFLTSRQEFIEKLKNFYRAFKFWVKSVLCLAFFLISAYQVIWLPTMPGIKQEKN